jgi:pimeloyl-ACP methyl ester carboxylesterase
VLASATMIGCGQQSGGNPSSSTAKTSTPPGASLQIVSENVSWAIEDTEVLATVTRPDDKKVHPGIVFIAGSGPTDRDWNSPLLPGTNGSGRLLAEELARQGYVTIRYDKRVSGPNAQKNLPLLVGKISMKSHLDELAGAVNLLVSRSDVDSKRIYAFGNSEGTIHALNYQIGSEPKFAGLILTGCPGRTLAAVTRGQIEAQVATLPNAKEIMAGYDRLMADFQANKPFVADPSVPQGINDLFQGLNAPINLPFTREFFPIDASLMLPKVTAPVLVVIGKKDVQIDYQLDGSLLEAAVKGTKNVTFAYPENANHVLKNETRPRSALTGADALTYNAADRVLDPEAVQIIKDWLARQK